MADSLLKPDSAGSMPGGITAADSVLGTPTPGAGGVNGAPTGNDAAPGSPDVTGPGVTGGTPTGGGKAVPDDAAFENSGTVGDGDSLDDSGDTGDAFPGNQGAQPPTPGDTDLGDAGRPTISDTGGGSDAGGVPTGGLSGAGTTGGAPTGGVDSGLGSQGAK